MGKQKRYPPGVRERAVRLVAERKGDYPSEFGAIRSIAGKIGCTAETLRSWVRALRRIKVSEPIWQQMIANYSKLWSGKSKELRYANEILKRASERL